MKTYHYYRPIWVVVMALLAWTARAQLVINYQLPDSTQATYEDSQIDITKTAGSYEFNGLDISKVNYITRFKSDNTKEGHVTLPEGAPMAPNTLSVICGESKVRVDKNGYFSIPGRILTVMNADDNIVFSSVVSKSQDDGMASIEINSMETAVTLMMSVINPLLTNIDNSVFYKIKQLVSELKSAAALAEAIDQSIIKYGYLNMDVIDATYSAATEELIDACGLRDLWQSGKIEEIRLRGASQNNTFTQDNLRIKLVETWPSKVTIEDDILNATRNTEGYKVKLNALNYNRFGYTAIMTGRVQPDGSVKPVSNSPIVQLKYMVPPVRVQSFMKTFLSLDGIFSMIVETGNLIKNAREEDIIYALEESKLGNAYLDGITLDFTTNEDVIWVAGSRDNNSVLVYNVIRGIFAQLIEVLAEKLPSDELEDAVEEFVEETIKDDELMSTVLEAMDTKSDRELAPMLFSLFKDKVMSWVIKTLTESTQINGISLDDFLEFINKGILKYEKEIEKYGDLALSALGLTEGSFTVPVTGLDLPTEESVRQELPTVHGATDYTVSVSTEGPGKVKVYRDGQPTSETSFTLNKKEGIHLEFEAVPDAGYVLGSWQIRGSIAGTDTRYELQCVPGFNCINTGLKAYFRKLEQVKTNFSSGLHGTITAKWLGSPTPVESGVTLLPDTATVIYTAHPDKGYKVSKWVQNGFDWATDKRQMNGGIVNGMLMVVFEEDPDYDYTKDPDYNPASTSPLVVESQIPNGEIEHRSIGIINITSGSGSYQVESSNTIAFPVELSGNVVKVHADRTESAVITITDLVTGQTQTVNVSSILQGLEVSQTELTIYQGEIAAVDITKGSGNYHILRYRAGSLVDANISSNIIRFEGLWAGQETFTLKDVYQSGSVNITVSVRKSNLKLGAKSVSVNLGSSARVSILKGSGDYSVQTSINSILATLSGNDIIISANEKKSGYVTVTDNETLARQTITVSVDADGMFFWAVNDDHEEIGYKVLSVEESTCEVARYSDRVPAVRKNIESLTIPERVNGYSVVSIGEKAFSGCYGLTDVNIPESVTSIGNQAFYGCYSLQSFDIPDGVTDISNYLFSGCRNLKSVTIPNSVKSIGFSAFQGCKSLTSIDIPNSVIAIGESAFSRTGLASLKIPNSVKYMGPSVFQYCDSLVSVDISNGMKSITLSCFEGCRFLTSVEIPNSVTSIGRLAFRGCTSLTSITIPNSVTTIENSAFSGCSSLSSVTIPNSVASIGDFAFNHCSSLKTIEIPNGVSRIGEATFQLCESLTTVKIPESVTIIDRFAFNGCISLKTVILPQSVTTIEENAFGYCGLTSVNIPPNVTTLSSTAFYTCTKLSTVISEIKKPFKVSFSDYCPKDTLYVPYGTKELYLKTSWWYEFKNIIEMDSGLNPFELSASEASVVAGAADYKVEITSGNDSYTVSSSDESVATAKIEKSDGKTYVVITALKAGKATITVTDEESSEKKEIQVEVHTPGELYMIVNHQSSPVEIGLSGHPHVTYTSNQLKIQTPDRTYSFSVNEVNGISFGKKTTNQ